MSIMCRLFGHEPRKAYASNVAFLEIDPPYHDGIGRSHRNLWAKCERCNRPFMYGKTIDRATSIEKGAE